MTPGALSPRDFTFLLIAGVLLLGGLLAIYFARKKGKRSPLPVPGLDRLTEPTHAVIGVACAVGAYHFAAPVFGWPGLRSVMGALAALAVLAVAGSVIMDLLDERSAEDQEQ